MNLVTRSLSLLHCNFQTYPRCISRKNTIDLKPQVQVAADPTLLNKIKVTVEIPANTHFLTMTLETPNSPHPYFLTMFFQQLLLEKQKNSDQKNKQKAEVQKYIVGNATGC